MIYSYRHCVTDEFREVEGSMSDPPAWKLEIDGEHYYRVFSGITGRVSQTAESTERNTRGERIGSRSLPKHWPFATKFDSAGRPCFDSTRERNEAHARAAAVGEVLRADDLSKPGNPKGLIYDS